MNIRHITKNEITFTAFEQSCLRLIAKTIAKIDCNNVLCIDCPFNLHVYVKDTCCLQRLLFIIADKYGDHCDDNIKRILTELTELTRLIK